MRIAKYFSFFLTIIILTSCSSQNSKVVIAEFGDNKIYLDEFENAYAKNSGGIEKAKEDSLSALHKFIDLYLNYKMKLRDAAVRGYKSDSEMKKELLDYKLNIGKTIYLQQKLYEPNLKQLFDRRKTEYRVSHIFLIPDSVRNEQQTVEFGNQLIKRIQNGEDFAALAKLYSKDTYTNMSGGDVYYVTAGQINIPSLENALYKTEPGTIFPELVQTPYGYHIIKVTERIPRKASIRAQHILVTFSDSTGTDTAKAINKIQDIEKQLKAGKDFAELASKYSFDKGSASKGGDLGFFQRGQLVREFDEAVFKLNIGEVSPIVKTNFGFHLIKLTALTPDKSYEEQKTELKEMYDRVRYKADFDELVQKLKTEFKFIQNPATFNKVLAHSDTMKIGEAYLKSNLKAQVGNDEIFNINSRSFTCDSLFMNMIDKGTNLNMTVNGKILQDAIDQYSSDLLIREKALNYDKENPEFAKLLEDYENGMYLFKILEEEVWSKIAIDSAKTFSFWEKTKNNYNWKDRVEFKEIYNPSDSLIKKCYSSVVSAVSYDSLFLKYNQRTGYENKPGYKGLVEVGFNKLAQRANALAKIGDVSEPFPFEEGFSIVKLIKREPARIKTYEEAKAEAASILQEKESKRLEDEYLNKLIKIYHPKIYYDELGNAFQKSN